MPPLQKPLPVEERAAFTVGDAVRYSSISKTTLYRLMDRGIIQFAQFGQRRLILRQSLDQLLTPTPQSPQ
ncbi:MAG: hypothetical protein CR217_06075 [Beijerinckiaceae bacterium]|nr:MAG: hypothetical protein CR217_06075 [Beijerinckiaceae bacterium]